METLGALVFLVILLGVPMGILHLRTNRRLRTIVECGSCSNRMTLKAWKAYGVCPVCGSDLYVETGELAN